MKNIIFFFLFIACFFSKAKSQTSEAGEFNGKVIFISAATPGIITVSSIGFARKKPGSSEDAAAGAIYTLLFRGIAGSQYDLPMVPNENEKKHDPAITALLDGGYSAFITENILLSEVKKKKKSDGVKGKMGTYRITINCDALRRHLEQNGVIRKFGI